MRCRCLAAQSLSPPPGVPTSAGRGLARGRAGAQAGRSPSVRESRTRAASTAGVDIARRVGAPRSHRPPGPSRSPAPCQAVATCSPSRHADGYAVTLLQLAATTCRAGRRVSKGAEVGVIGASSDAVTLQPHVHLGRSRRRRRNGYARPALGCYRAASVGTASRLPQSPSRRWPRAPPTVTAEIVVADARASRDGGQRAGKGGASAAPAAAPRVNAAEDDHACDAHSGVRRAPAASRLGRPRHGTLQAACTRPRSHRALRPPEQRVQVTCRRRRESAHDREQTATTARRHHPRRHGDSRRPRSRSGRRKRTRGAARDAVRPRPDAPPDQQRATMTAAGLNAHGRRAPRRCALRSRSRRPGQAREVCAYHLRDELLPDNPRSTT